jgi:hypothetical protein
MSFETDTDIAGLLDGFRNRSLPKVKWTHAAHWAAALGLIAEDAPAAYRDMPGMIRSYNESVGGRNTDTEGYHETITIASLKATEHAYCAAPEGAPLHTVLTGLLEGPCGKPDWVFEYWRRDTLFSVKARREWVEPDIRALPY